MLLFSKIDLLGVPATLNFFGNEKRKSNFGGLCTVVFLAFVAWSIYNSSLDLVNRTNPKITLSETNVEDPREVNISLSEFPIAFMIQGSTAYNNNSAFKDESIYTLQVNHLVIERILQPDGTYKRNATRIPLTLENCTKEHFSEYASSFSTFAFRSMYCISKNYTGQLKFQGQLTSTIYHAINGLLRMCNPATSKVNCSSQEVINQAMSGGYLNIFYMDNMMNIQNYSNPTEKYRELYSTILNPLSYKELNMDVGFMSITTDTGLIVEDLHTETTLKVKNTKEIVDLNPSLVKTLIYFYMQGSRTETYYTRSYKKIPTIMAEVGSLANAFLGIVLILISPYLRLKSREALMNELFDIGETEGTRKKVKPPGKSSFYEKQTSNGNQKQVRMEKNQEDKKEKEPKGKWKPRNLRLATETKTFISERMLSNENFQTFPNEIQEIPEAAKLEIKPQLASEQDVNNQILSPKDSVSQPLFYASNKKRQSNQYSQFTLSPIESPTTLKEGNTTRRLISESYRVTRMDGDKYEDKEFDQMMYQNEEVEKEDGIEEQLEYIDSPKPEVDTLNGEILEAEKVKIEFPVDTDVGRENYKRSSTEKNIVNAQEKEKIGEGKGGKLVGKCFSMEKKKSTSNAELRIWEYMLSFVYKPKRLQNKITTIQQGVKNIEERLDLSNILKKFYEVDKLIALLLDRDQLELFNNMPKPQLRKWEMNHLHRQHTFEANLSKKLSNVKTMRNEDYMQQSYERVLQKGNKSDIDKRLIGIFKDKFI